MSDLPKATMITDVEDFFDKGCGRCDRFATPDCSTRFWLQGLLDLRAICRDMGLSEHVKWGHPCYMHAGRNIAIFGAFRGDYRITFFEAGLLSDPDGLLERQGPNTQTPDCLRLTDAGGVPAMEPAIRGFLTQSMRHAEQGLRAPRPARDIDLPDELVEALDSDPDLAEAFAALTPGRQKSYAFALNSAKTPATRIARIARYRDKILAGKGALDR
jgi:uncharacterized protein YdeI (YjbR/CyaY-like superfamily)